MAQLAGPQAKAPFQVGQLAGSISVRTPDVAGTLRAMCSYDIEEGELTVMFPIRGELPDLRIDDEPQVELTELELLTPIGVVRSERVASKIIRFATDRDFPGGSTRDTEGAFVLGERSYWHYAVFVVDQPLACVTSTPGPMHEFLFAPGISTYRITEASGVLVSGDDRTLSIRSNTPLVWQEARFIASLVAGAPATRILALNGSSLELFRGQIGQTKGILLCAEGRGYADLSMREENVRRLVEGARAVWASMDVNHRRNLANAVHLFLEGRARGMTAHAKLFAAFHFLEYLTTSRTLVQQELSQVLGVPAVVARSIKRIRDLLLHHRGDQIALFVAARQDLRRAAPEFYKEFRDDIGDEFFWANVITALCTKALLTRLGCDDREAAHLAPRMEAT